MKLNIDSIIGVIHLDWDKGEPLYLYSFGTPACKERVLHVRGRCMQRLLESSKNF
jgi:hypothetical protein